MKTVTLSVATRQAVKRRALDAFCGKRRGAHLSFASADLFWKVLTAKRWELLKSMAGGGAMTLREAARRAGRDVKAVHGDQASAVEVRKLRFDLAPSDLRSRRLLGGHLDGLRVRE